MWSTKTFSSVLSPGAAASKNNFCSTHELEKVEGYQSVRKDVQMKEE